MYLCTSRACLTCFGFCFVIGDIRMVILFDKRLIPVLSAGDVRQVAMSGNFPPFSYSRTRLYSLKFSIISSFKRRISFTLDKLLQFIITAFVTVIFFPLVLSFFGLMHFSSISGHAIFKISEVK